MGYAGGIEKVTLKKGDIMKLEQQLKEIVDKRGKELSEQAKTLDKIEINEKRFIEIQAVTSEILEKEAVLTVPILKKGVFIYKQNGYHTGVIFNVDLQEKIVRITVNVYIDDFEKPSPQWVYDCDYEMPYTIKKGQQYDLVNFEDSVTKIFQLQKRKQKEINNHIKQSAIQLTEIFQRFMLTVYWLNYLMAHPEEKEVSRKRKSSENSKTKAKSASTKPVEQKEHVVRLNGIYIKTENTKAAKKIKSRKIVHVTECWTVRGHFRHYKTGKIIYIQPYEKGTDKNKHTPKKYTL